MHRTSGTSERAHFIHPALLFFIVIYSLLVVYCRLALYRDPTSLFFDSSMAYRREYSSVRQRQAERFIDGASRTPFLRSDNSMPPSLCVGVATVARDGEHYFQTSVGSLLQGLTEAERQEMHLIAFIAHTDPTAHPAYSERWLYNVADQVLTYDLPPDQLERLRGMEREKGVFREKGLYDYRYLLDACYRVGAANIIMVEDDVLALDGWYHRTVKALEIARQQTYMKGVTECMFPRRCAVFSTL
jgi:N-Acetylglucosaminyltransferase-IV (GnT-IV) conserved region